MENPLFKYIWCVEYPYRSYWEIIKIKKYYEDPQHAQEFVSNYDKISTNDIGPCKWIENNVVRPKVEQFLAVEIKTNVSI
jgi:hypothetical protein